MRWLVDNITKVFSPTFKDVILLSQNLSTIFTLNGACLCYGRTKDAIETIIESFKVVCVSTYLLVLVESSWANFSAFEVELPGSG